MRKAAVLVVGMLIGGVVGAVGWQVAFAVPAPLDTLVVCERAGSDLRSPATNGSCPSGYTKKEITETAPSETTVWNLSEQIIGPLGGTSELAGIDVPAGTYAAVATGYILATGPTSMVCRLSDNEDNQFGPFVDLRRGDGATAHGALSGVVTVPAATIIFVACDAPTPLPVEAVEWDLTLTPVDTLLPPPP